MNTCCHIMYDFHLLFMNDQEFIILKWILFICRTCCRGDHVHHLYIYAHLLLVNINKTSQDMIEKIHSSQ